jgi:hypothetical protein
VVLSDSCVRARLLPLTSTAARRMNCEAPRAALSPSPNKSNRRQRILTSRSISAHALWLGAVISVSVSRAQQAALFLWLACSLEGYRGCLLLVSFSSSRRQAQWERLRPARRYSVRQRFHCGAFGAQANGTAGALDALSSVYQDLSLFVSTRFLGDTWLLLLC